MTNKKRLAIITTHPIQYYAPVFKLLQQRGKIIIKVFYTAGEDSLTKFDPGFKQTVTWDIPLLEGYEYEFVENTAAEPGSHGFKGIINPGLIAKVNEFKPDDVLVYGWAYNSHLKVLRHFKKKFPLIFRGDSNLLDERPGMRSILRTVFLRWVYQHVDHAFYVGTYNKAYFKKYGLEEEQLSFAPHAIDNERFAADRKNETILLRQQLGIDEHEILILFAGKFEDKKDPVTLLRAFLSLNAPKTHLLFAGNGVLETDLKGQAMGDRRVHFMEFQNQRYMPVVYQACDLYCLPSKGPAETWGLAVNEAMAAGKAVLITDKVGCGTDLVKHGKNGEIFKAGDLADLITKLEVLIKYNRTGLAEMGKVSADIIKDWSFEQQVKNIEAFLNE